MTGGMSPEEFQNYIGLLSRLLRLRATERGAIEEELRSHLEERLAALTAEGIEPARAVSMALAEFGDAAALAAEFTAVSRLYKRRWIMRLSVGSIAASIIMAGVLVSYWPGGPVQLTQNMAQAQQAEKAQETPAPSVTTEPEKLDANAQTQAKLEKLIDVEFIEQPLSKVIANLAADTKVQFFLDTRILNEAGINTDAIVTLSMKNVPAEMIMRLIFRNLNLAYWLDNGVVFVSTTEEADANLESRVYRIDDLLSSPPTDKYQEIPDGSAKKQKVNYDRLIDLITSTVRPTSWDSVGGPASICPYRGTLVISQTSTVHKEVHKLLNDLRQSINKEIEDEGTVQPQRKTGMGDKGRMDTMNKKSGDKDYTVEKETETETETGINRVRERTRH